MSGDSNGRSQLSDNAEGNEDRRMVVILKA